MSGSRIIGQVPSPDEAADGLIEGPLDPLRYDFHVTDPDEVGGIVTSMIPRGSRVLEVGCGTGSLSKIVADLCHAEVVGIEPDSLRAERAKARGLEVYTGYLTVELVREIGPFDIVLLTDVLEHLPNPLAMLRLCRTALKPGGAIIISVPNVAHWSVRLNILFGKFKYSSQGIMDATHLRWFTATSIRSLVRYSGFRVIDYRATAVSKGIDNACRRPMSWLPLGARRPFLVFASRRWPSLFGCQHVLKAEMVTPYNEFG